MPCRIDTTTNNNSNHFDAKIHEREVGEGVWGERNILCINAVWLHGVGVGGEKKWTANGEGWHATTKIISLAKCFLWVWPFAFYAFVFVVRFGLNGKQKVIRFSGKLKMNAQCSPHRMHKDKNNIHLLLRLWLLMPAPAVHILHTHSIFDNFCVFGRRKRSHIERVILSHQNCVFRRSSNDSCVNLRRCGSASTLCSLLTKNVNVIN